MPSITDVGLCIRAAVLSHPETKVVFAATNANPPELALLRCDANFFLCQQADLVYLIWDMLCKSYVLRLRSSSSIS